MERFINTSWERSSSARRCFSRASFWAGSSSSSSADESSTVAEGASSISDMRGEKEVRRGSWTRVWDGANAFVVAIAREMARIAARLCLGIILSSM